MILPAGSHVIKPGGSTPHHQNSFTQINDLMKQGVTTSATARLAEMNFRFFCRFFRSPEREGKLPIGSDHGKWSLPTEPSCASPPLLRGFHTPRRCNHTLAYLLIDHC